MTRRPWRLTRRQRVEMEAALSKLREARNAPVAGYVRLLANAHPLDCYDNGRDDEWKVMRARVAIALRAALRADEDARCEEALASAGYGEEAGATPGDAWDMGYDRGAIAVIDALREWPDLDRGWWNRVPLALWERTR